MSEANRLTADKSVSKDKHAGFFAIDLAHFYRACDIGLNEACLYLTLACGTGKSNTETSWSLTSFMKYGGISRSKARLAMKGLQDQVIVRKLKEGKHPRYELIGVGDTDLFWLPKEFVMGADDEAPPLKLMREAGDVELLRLVGLLYHLQNIAEEGGITRSLVSIEYSRERIAEHGAYRVYGFNKEKISVGNNYAEYLCSDTGAELADNAHESLTEHIKALENMGLIYWVPTVFEHGEGEVLFPLVDPFTEEEIDALNVDLHNFLVPQFSYLGDSYDFTIPVPKHYQKVQLAGVAVLRYRQKTSLVSAGRFVMQEKIAKWSAEFETLNGMPGNNVVAFD